MKKSATNFIFILLVALGWFGNTFAQAPEGIIYQAEARDSKNNLLTNKALDVKISIIQGTLTGTVAYEELHKVTTNIYGMFVLVIGQGTNTSGQLLENVKWGNYSHFLNVQVKEAKKNVWTDMGTSQLLSVPYALHAKTAETVTGTNATPSFLTQVQRDALSPIAGLMVYNTTTNKPNIYNGTEWMNYDGTSAKTLAIGVSYQGGIIAYILQTGDPGYVDGETHGIIAAPSDQSTSIQWYNGFSTITGATGTAIGTGQANTTAIVINQGVGRYAAQLCNDLVLGGYSDWYLPSKDELNKLYINRVAVGGFASAYYWSSTESNIEEAWTRGFGEDYQESEYKEYSFYVRAVRAF